VIGEAASVSTAATIRFVRLDGAETRRFVDSSGAFAAREGLDIVTFNITSARRPGAGLPGTETRGNSVSTLVVGRSGERP